MYALANNLSGFTNTVLGNFALLNNCIGSENIAIGFNALRNNNVGWNNVGIGNFAGYSNCFGCGNVFIGNCVVGDNTNDNNKLYIGNPEGTLIYGDFYDRCVVICGKEDVCGNDIEILTTGCGLIIKSSNGTRYRICVNNSGVLGTVPA